MDEDGLSRSASPGESEAARDGGMAEPPGVGILLLRVLGIQQEQGATPGKISKIQYIAGSATFRLKIGSVDH